MARLIRLYNPEDFVVLKMDIEGSEYDIIFHLMAEHVFSLIDEIGVEYHGYLSPFKSVEDLFSQYFKRMKTHEFNWN